MQVILLENIKNIGKRFTVKSVSDGYARNFLIPRGLAEVATPKKLESLKSRIIAATSAEKLAESEYTKLVSELSDKQFELHAKASEEGSLYAAIDDKQIAGLLQENGHTMITDEYVDLARPIKTVGAHNVIIKFSDAHQATIIVNVVKTDHE